MGGPFGGMQTRWEPRSGAVGLAVVLPGRGYSPAAPLLELARLALLQHGWTVQQVWWEVPAGMDLGETIAWVADQLGSTLAAEGRPPGRVLVAGKSLGTLAAPYVAQRGYDAIWFTPLLVEPEVVEGIRRNLARQLLIGGDDDRLWDAHVAADLAAAGCEVLEVLGADHSMSVSDDAVRTAEIQLDVARAVDEFLTGI